MNSTVATSTETKALSVQAVLVAYKKATFSSPLTGKITSLKFNEGETFKKGDLLFSYDCVSIKARHREKNAEKNATWAKLEASRKLKELKSASDLEVTLSLMDFRKADAAADISAEQVKQCRMVAPYNGRITERKVNLYETANEGQEMLSIISTDRLHIRMLVPSKWLSWVKVGTPLNVTVHETQQTYPAKIIRIGGSVDEISQSITVIAEISESHKKLLPGMSGLATFKSAEH